VLSVSTTPVLFAGLVDDAAMFPPGNASPAAAIGGHLGFRAAPFAGLVGPLLVAAQRWDDFVDAHASAGSPELEVTLVGSDAPPDRSAPTLTVTGFEVPVTAPPLPRVPAAYQVACEISGATDSAGLLAAVAHQRSLGERVIAKFRTGGTTADAFPGNDTVADLLVEAAAVSAPLKFTAGLHAAVRCTDPATGFEHQGFLNLMWGSLLARRGADTATVAAVLAVRDRQAVAAEVASWSAAEAADVRAAFVSFGCCGVEDPVTELVTLRLLELEGS
jgi:hypothetical protein